MKPLGMLVILGAILLGAAAYFADRYFDPNQIIMLYLGAGVFGLVGLWLLFRNPKS